MNYRTLVKGALALSLSLIVGSVSAATTTYNDVQEYGAMFETTANTPAGAFNDYNYEVGSNITAYADATTGVGWFSGDAESDESKIIERTDEAAGQALQLNTDASTLTNKFASSVADAINNTIGGLHDTPKGTAYFETEVKFVPSDTPEAGINGNEDATKFAIYAYANEDVNPPVTNLVVFHAYEYTDEHDDVVTIYTNEVIPSVTIDAEKYTKLRIEMKQIDFGDNDMRNVFSVSIDDAAPITSPLAKADGIWFQTIEQAENDDNKLVSSLNFKGTGEIDNIKAGTIAATTEYAIDWTGSQNVVVSNATAQLTVADTNFTAGAVLTFYPTEGSITNVNGVAQDPALEVYTYTVGTEDAIVTVLAGEEPSTPTYAVSWTVDKVAVSNTTDSAAVVEAVAGSFEAGTKLTFYPEEGSITNLVVNGSPVDPLPAGAYEYTVLAQADQTIVAKAGEAAVVRVKPAWADDADTTKFWNWVDTFNVENYSTDYTAQYLMNVDETANPVLKIDSIVVTDEGSQIVVSAADGNTAIDLAQINGVLNVSVGSSVTALTSKAIPANNKGIPAAGKVSVIIKSADGAFAKATVDFLPAETQLQEVQKEQE